MLLMSKTISIYAWLATREARIDHALEVAAERRYTVCLDDPEAIGITLRRPSWESANVAARQLERALVERGYRVDRDAPVQLGGGMSDADAPHEVIVSILVGR